MWDSFFTVGLLIFVILTVIIGGVLGMAWLIGSDDEILKPDKSDDQDHWKEE